MLIFNILLRLRILKINVGSYLDTYSEAFKFACETSYMFECFPYAALVSQMPFNVRSGGVVGI